MPVISAPHLENVRSLIIIIEQKKKTKPDKVNSSLLSLSED